MLVKNVTVFLATYILGYIYELIKLLVAEPGQLLLVQVRAAGGLSLQVYSARQLQQRRAGAQPAPRGAAGPGATRAPRPAAGQPQRRHEQHGRADNAGHHHAGAAAGTRAAAPAGPSSYVLTLSLFSLARYIKAYNQ
ncbi:hypothetical protein evm_013441 [Chilo suppressalis]|nr:hypothetical protein evm_013441 [Chilo suppressalis]